MTNEEKLIADIDSTDPAALSAEMLASMPDPEMFPLIIVNMQGRVSELENREGELIKRIDALINRLHHLGVA
ncbi:assembly protein [Enterobacteria phage PRDcobalt]